MRRLLVAAALFAVTNTLLAQDIVLPDGKARTLIEESCSECHGLDQVAGNAMSRDAWRTTVNRMVKRGAPLSPAQIDMVVDYLAVYFAPDKINVNTSTAKELQAALGFTEAEAAAVVTARAKNKIETLEALAKVPGLDAKKLDAKKDLILF